MGGRSWIDWARWCGGAALAAPGLPALLGGRLPRVFIGYYHRVYVEDGQPLYQLGIHRDRFRAQLRDLQRWYRFRPLDEVLEAACTGSQRERVAALTFDDGYRDNLVTALPVLRELGIPATIFLVAGLIGGRERLWYDQVKSVCSCAPGPTLRLPAAFGGGTCPIPDAPARRTALRTLLDRSKELEDETRRDAVRRLVEENFASARFDDGTDSLLSWGEARAMEAEGVRFGSHTLTHPFLPRIRDHARLREELVESRKTLEAHLAHPLPILAYPGGANSPEVRAAAREAGYRWALGNRPGVVGPQVDPFLLPRRALGPRSSSLGPRHSDRVLRAEVGGLFDRLRAGRAAAPGGAVPAPTAAPPFAEGTVARRFDEAAAAYARSRETDPAYTGERRRLLEFLPAHSGRLIEVGCGSGNTAVRLAAAGWQVVATDISSEMLRQTGVAAAERGTPLLGRVRCDLQRLPFRDASADVLLVHGVLEYVPDQKAALSEVHRALRAGGAALLTAPNRGSPASRIAALLGLAVSLRRRLLGQRTARVPARHLLPGELDRMAAAAGLSRRGGVLQTFALLPVDLFPRSWLAFNNRVMERLPRGRAWRWWGWQYVARYDRLPGPGDLDPANPSESRP